MKMKTPEDRKKIRIPEVRITEAETINTAASGTNPEQNKTAADILAEMEERRQAEIKEAYNKMADCEFKLDDAKGDMKKYENQPDRAEKYAVAVIKAQVAQRNIDNLKSQIHALKHWKAKIATDNETQAFYERLYIENMEELREIAISFRDSYEFLIALTRRAKGIFENANYLAHTWDDFISLKDSGHISKFGGFLIMPGLTALSDTNCYFRIHENYEDVIYRLNNELKDINTALNDLLEQSACKNIE